MPRVKLIYVGNGEYVEPRAKWQECDHPREWRRFYPDAFPSRTYCCLCGWGNINPFYGYTEEEIAAAKQRAEELRRRLNLDREQDPEGET